MDRRQRVGGRTKRKYKNIIRDVVKSLSRKVTVYRPPLESECPNCFYDKLTHTSTGKCKYTVEEVIQLNDPTRYKYFLRGRCPICLGKGLIEIQRRKIVDCLIEWNPSPGGQNELVFTPAGKDMATLVLLKTHPKNIDLFRECIKFIVDGIECRLARPPILTGLGNQSVLSVLAFSDSKSSIYGSEIVKDYSDGE